jgi:hypothetical protein
VRDGCTRGLGPAPCANGRRAPRHLEEAAPRGPDPSAHPARARRPPGCRRPGVTATTTTSPTDRTAAHRNRLRSSATPCRMLRATDSNFAPVADRNFVLPLTSIPRSTAVAEQIHERAGVGFLREVPEGCIPCALGVDAEDVEACGAGGRMQGSAGAGAWEEPVAVGNGPAVVSPRNPGRVRSYSTLHNAHYRRDCACSRGRGG